MAKKIFGLDISDHSIEVVQLDAQFRKAPKVVAYARTLLPATVIKRGVIKKPEKLVELLRTVLVSAKPQAITSNRCIVSIPDAHVFTAVFKFPAGLKPVEIRNTIPYKAEEVIPFHSPEIYFDFKILTTKDGTQEVLYVASPKEVVDSYVGVLKQAGLEPVALDIEAQGLARALVQPELTTSEQTGGIALVDIGAQTSNLTIYDDQGIRQSGVSEIAGNAFTKAISKQAKITLKEADALKMEIGFTSKDKKKKGVSALLKQATELSDTIKEFITYYQQETSRSVYKVILTGGSSLLPAIDTFFSETLELPVEIGDPLKSIEDPQKLVRFKTKSVLFSNVIGQALRGVGRHSTQKDINLLGVPPVAISKKLLLLLGTLALLIIMFIGLWYFRPLSSSSNITTFDEPELDVNLVQLELLRREAVERQLLMDKISKPDALYAIVRNNDDTQVPVYANQAVSSDQIDFVSEGTTLPILDVSTDGMWLKVLLAEATTAWMPASTVLEVQYEDLLNNDFSAESFIVVRSSNVQDVTLFADQDTESELPNLIDIGLYELLEDDDEWFQIDYNGDPVWVLSQGLATTTAPEFTLPWWMQSIETPDSDELQAEDNTISENTESDSATSTDEVLANEGLGIGEILETTIGYLNVRSGPGTSYEKVGEVLVGSQHVIYEEQDGWYLLQLDEQDGWVYSLYVDLQPTE